MKEKYYIEIILTTDQKIRLCLDSKVAPISVANFVDLVEKKYFDGVIFHRIIKDFMIQTGGYKINENNELYECEEIPAIEGEFASNGHPENTLSHELGVISMARTSIKNSATSQFFICAAPCSWLDGEYAAFGYCIDEESKKVVLEVSNVQTYRAHPAFTDFPCELIGIKTINFIEE
jgi:peptidyl-prolyl cis-trans isomerase B (cyclophilin B)